MRPGYDNGWFTLSGCCVWVGYRLLGAGVTVLQWISTASECWWCSTVPPAKSIWICGEFLILVGCWKFFILATFQIISEWVTTWNSALGNQAASTMTRYATQLYYPNSEPTSPCPALLMASARLGSDDYQFYKSLVWLSEEPNSWSTTREASSLPIRQSRPIWNICARKSCMYFPSKAKIPLVRNVNMMMNANDEWY